MKQVTSFTNASFQRQQIPLDNGETVDFLLYYLPTQYGWYFDFTYNDYISRGNKVVLSPNTLRHLRKILPFGIGFMAQGNVEPYSISDFTTQRVQMFILNIDDVAEIEETIYNV